MSTIHLCPTPHLLPVILWYNHSYPPLISVKKRCWCICSWDVYVFIFLMVIRGGWFEDCNNGDGRRSSRMVIIILDDDDVSCCWMMQLQLSSYITIVRLNETIDRKKLLLWNALMHHGYPPLFDSLVMSDGLSFGYKKGGDVPESGPCPCFHASVLSFNVLIWCASVTSVEIGV